MRISQEAAVELWGNIDGTEEIHIYINIPFCFCQCRYCLYKGKNRSTKEERTYFVRKHLIPSLRAFHNIFEAHPVNTIYFGGGTPNTLPVGLLKEICEEINAFSRARNRIIEINPAFADEEYINALCHMGFTLITFGIQSFDETALSFQCRPSVGFDKMKRLIDICHHNQVYTSVDLMAYLKTYTKKDLEILQKDISMVQNLNVDFSTVYPELNLVLIDEKARRDFIAFMQSLELRNYYLDDDILDLKTNPRSITRMVHKRFDQQDMKDFLLPYRGNDFPYAEHNILGFGDWRCRQEIMSYSPKRFFYTEKAGRVGASYELKYRNDIGGC